MEYIYQIITDFIEKSIDTGDLHPVDKYYAQNRLLALFNQKNFKRMSPSDPLPNNRLDILDQLLEYAVKEKLIEDLSSSKDVLGSQIMDIVTPKPSIINEIFWNNYEEDPKKATDSFFEMSKQNNYIKTREIAQNIDFEHDTEFGKLQLTVNLSKPEKSSEEIEMARENASNYPFSTLSIENEGYLGHIAHAGRTNHRVIRMNLKGEKWGFQFSPYAYYNEHSIFLSIENRPMDVGIQAIRNLLEIITQLPHYFVGSNAGLPIVGGSILAQDHYQGGRHVFPLDKAEIIHEFEIEKVKEVHAGIVHWPMATIRLASRDKEKIIEAAQIVMTNWQMYSDESVDIFSETNGKPHNAVTPIARREDELFVLDLVLRNNRTTAEYPDGIFHSHPNVQHIKKENIGLIEVLGRAILPPRLKTELKGVKEYLLKEKNSVVEIHQTWADGIKNRYDNITEANIDGIVKKEVGEVFLQVLKDASVFKTNEKGKKAFEKFVKQIK